MNDIVLSGRNISMRYGSRVVLDDISIDIRAGEVTALLGPNGAGKSTLLKLLCGEIPSQNDIQFFGKQKTTGSLQRAPNTWRCCRSTAR